MYSAVSACWCRLRISQGVRWARCTTAGREDVDGTGCVVQYEHPLCSDRYSFVKSPADLNGALLLKRREAISSAKAHLRAGVPGGWKHFWVICRLRGSRETTAYPQRFTLSAENYFTSKDSSVPFLQWIKGSGVPGLCPKGMEIVIFDLVLPAVCCQKWIRLSEVLHPLRSVGKQKFIEEEMFVYFFYLTIKHFQLVFSHPADVIVCLRMRNTQIFFIAGHEAVRSQHGSARVLLVDVADRPRELIQQIRHSPRR